MCILKNCADPTAAGVWWRDDNQWTLYTPDQQKLIRASVQKGLQTLDLGIIKSSVHPHGQQYTLDLVRMEQYAVNSGQRRPVKIIELPENSVGKTLGKIHYRNACTGELLPYDPEIATALLRVLQIGGEKSTVMTSPKTGIRTFFDLERMKEYTIERMDENGEIVFSKELPSDIVMTSLDRAWPAAKVEVV